MNDVDDRLGTLRDFDVPSAPDVQGMRNRRRVRRARGAALGAVALVAVGAALFGSAITDDDRDDDVAIDAADESDVTAPVDPLLRATDFARTAAPPAIADLGMLPACEGPDDLASVLATVDPTQTLGLGEVPGAAVAPDEVLDRVPVDVQAAAIAGCARAWVGAGQDVVAILLRDPSGALLYAAATGPDDGSLAVDRLAGELGDVSYHQSGLGSGQPFVGYVAPEPTDGLSLVPTRILGAIRDRRVAVRAPVPPDDLYDGEPSADYYRPGVAAVAHLIQTPLELGAPNDFTLMAAPRQLPPDAARCLEAPFATPPTTWWCTSMGVIVIRWSERGQIEPIDGDPVEVHGLSATVETAAGRTQLWVETRRQSLLVDAPSQLTVEQVIDIAESIPALAPPPEIEPAGEEDLRGELSEEWLRGMLPPGFAAATTQAHGPEQVGVMVIDPDGRQFTVIATPEIHSVVPPFPTETTSVQGVDVVVSTADASQAVTGFVCGNISWQVVGSDQNVRRSVVEVTETIIATLDC